MYKNSLLKKVATLFTFNLFFAFNLFAQPVTGFDEDFDDVTAPALPTGWQSVSLQGTSAAITTTSGSDTSPNSVILPNPNTKTDLTLVSPVITFSGGTGNYDLQVNFSHKRGMETNFDIGVLEISINGAAFKDFKDPSFHVTDITGDYNLPILNNNLNPLNGRAGWTGTSGGFENVSFKINNISDNASIRFRFRIATDTIVGTSGWLIDSFDATPVVDTRCEIQPFNSTVLSGQTASFIFNVKNPSSVSVVSPVNMISVHSGYKIESLSLMPGSFSSPVTVLSLPGSGTYQLIDSDYIAPNSVKKFKIDVKTSSPPQASAVLTFEIAGSEAYNGAKLAATFLSTSKNLPDAGLNNVPLFAGTGPDFCNPIPTPIPAGLSGAVVLNFIITSCPTGQAALNAQNAGAIAYIGIPTSVVLMDPYNPPPLYVVEPPTPGLNIPVFTSDSYYLSQLNQVALPVNPAAKISIMGSNNPKNSTLVASMQNIGGDSEILGNNFCTGLVNLVTDQDADGTFDYNDGCPSDPAKTSSGTCGCGAIDIDANSNGIIDCLTSQEDDYRKTHYTSDFKNKLTSLLSGISKIKESKFSKLKKERNTAKSQIDEIVQLSQKKTDILLKSSADLTVLMNSLNTSGKKFLSKVKNFSKNKKAFVKSINAVLAVL